jgi:fermentation-respiration switch protein FrsA (DUF1100 family)
MEAQRLIPGKIYEPYHADFERWHQEAAALPQEKWSVVTPDGLTLRGTYYPLSPDAPLEILFHGYRSNVEHDLCGAIWRCFAVGRNALVVNQRGCGTSDGHVISFGINECKDCRRWIDFAVDHFGKDVRIVITGVSMGASTVMMAAGEELPPNVIGVLADCGYSSPRDIIRKVIRQLRLPVFPLYALIRLGGILFGHFDIESNSPQKAMETCRVPVIFFHGDTDDFVPCDMSRLLYQKCHATKKLVIVPGAGHGLAYLVDPENYLEQMRAFDAEYGGGTIGE